MASLPSSSSIPGALVGFLAVAKGALPDGTTVFFGALNPVYTTPLTLQINEITGDQQVAELGPQYRREETFNLICTLSSYQGGTEDFSGLLGQVMDSFALVSKAVGNDPQLQGSVRFAEVGNFQIEPSTDQNGLSAIDLHFQVRCQQRIRSLS